MTATRVQFPEQSFDEILKCVHCGLCLDACPTYRALGVEQDSPRGRLYLMRGLWEGVLSPNPEVLAPLDRCIGCRACESACPSMVPYGALLEKARHALTPHRAPQSGSNRMSRHLLLSLPTTTARLVWTARLARLATFLGLTGLARTRPVARLMPWLSRAASLMPRFALGSFKKAHAQQRPTAGEGPSVALFTGCITDVADHDTHRATLKLLQAAGCRVSIPTAQTCCGALAAHAGDTRVPQAAEHANISAFEAAEAVITNAAGCGAQLKTYGMHAETGTPTHTAATAFTHKVVDVVRFLGTLPTAKDPALWHDRETTVLYDAPCHLIAMGDEAQARSFLSGLPGLRLVPLCEAEQCCGAGGVYNLLQPDLSDQVLDRKLDDIEAMMARYPEARYLVTANPGCLYQLRMGCRRRKLALEVVHPAVLAASRLRG